MNLADRWSAQLDGLHRHGRYRRLSPPAGIDFSSNDYLGYGSGLPFRVCELASRPAAPRSAAASRLLRGHREIWDQVESQLAHWHKAEAALMFTTGYMANEGLLATIIEPGDWVASDEFNHASIIDGLRLARATKQIYRHLDADNLAAHLEKAHRLRSAEQALFIVTESLFSMAGECPPLAQIVELAEKHDAHVIVDEAHTTGCVGPEGAGLVNSLGLRSRVLATVHTGGKALAVPGAYVCGSAKLRELLINRCRHFIFTTALAPVIGEWWLETIARVRQDDAARERLASNLSLFRAAIDTRAPGELYIVPFFFGSDEDAVKASDSLRRQGYDIRAIRPPTVPEGTARLRVSIHADHDPGVLHAAAKALANEAPSLFAAAAPAIEPTSTP